MSYKTPFNDTVFRAIAVDMTSTGITSMGIPDRIFLPTELTFYATTLTGIGSSGIFQIGTNGLDYNNILSASSTATPEAIGTNKIVNIDIQTGANIVASGAEIFVNVTTGVTGTAEIMNFLLWGIFV